MEKAKVLIVEDETITALGIKKDLENSEEISVSIVNNAVDAVITAQQEKPDIIIMDIMLKGQLNGIDAAGIIAGKYNIPIIYLTAYHDDEIYHNANLTNPVKIINKPYNKSELITTINDVLINC
ncbi:MAG: response regulator, partial [Ignavibacteriaceae bacterium]|jgi:CheY-like chemotaxis protein